MLLLYLLQYLYVKFLLVKNNLLYYLEEERKGMIKISVKIKGYDDTSLLNKIIYGVN